MGLILNDRDLGIHCERHLSWGVDLYTDFANENMSITWQQVDEAIRLLTEAIDGWKKANESIPKSAT